MNTSSNNSPIDFSKIKMDDVLIGSHLSQCSFVWDDEAKEPTIIIHTHGNDYNMTRQTLDMLKSKEVHAHSKGIRRGGDNHTMPISVTGGDNVQALLQLPIDNPVIKNLQGQLGIKLESSAISPSKFG